VLLPSVAWWANSGNRQQFSGVFVGLPAQSSEEEAIQVHAEKIDGADVGSVLGLWMWKVKIVTPANSTWTDAWLVVKRKGNTVQVLHGGPIGQVQPTPGQVRTQEFIVVAYPASFGESMMGSEKATFRINGAIGKVIENPFRCLPGAAMSSPKPTFVGDRALLALAVQGNAVYGFSPTNVDPKQIAEYDGALLLVLTESIDHPPN
jgi:hypothetical protein